MSEPRGGFRIESTLVVDRSPEEVFAFLADTAKFQAVDPALVDYSPAGQLSAGLQGTFAHRRGWMVARTTWTVTEFDAPRFLVVEVLGAGYGMTEAATLEPAAGGTRATFVERVWPTTLPGRLLVSLSGGIMRRDLRARAERLRAALDPARDSNQTG
jgi:polyketide cyclase/dehydrase/lipid transport protein